MSPSPVPTLAVRLPLSAILAALLLSGAAPLAASSLGVPRPEPLTPPAREQSLVVPRFEVDSTSAGGTSTLFAVRNLTDSRTYVSASYMAQDGTSQGFDSRDLEPREIWTVNLRDVEGLQVDDDGFARGWVDVYAAGSTRFDRVIAGDWFQVDVEQGFATADEMPGYEVCRTSSLRFLDFGDGMDLTVFSPFGATFAVGVFDETGVPVGQPRVVETTGASSELQLSDLTSERFGTLVFDFSKTGPGIVFGRYRAEGRFSVSLPAVCEDETAGKLSPPAPETILFLPRYAVDTRSRSGLTTLLAVRNVVDEPVTVNILYQPADGSQVIGEQSVLEPRQVRAVNLRDVDGLAVDEDGVARGSVSVEAHGLPAGRPLVAADSLQVDAGSSFATGDLLHQANERCRRASIRFVDFQGQGGDGASFVLWLRRPPTARFAPAFTVTTYDERGRQVGEPYSVPADGQIMEMTLAQITTARFGSLVFDFAASESGLVLGRYSADGRFSVALGSVCEEPAESP